MKAVGDVSEEIVAMDTVALAMKDNILQLLQTEPFAQLLQRYRQKAN